LLNGGLMWSIDGLLPAGFHDSLTVSSPYPLSIPGSIAIVLSQINLNCSVSDHPHWIQRTATNKKPFTHNANGF